MADTPIGTILAFFTLGMVMLFAFPLFISAFGFTPDAQEYNTLTNTTINTLNSSITILTNEYQLVPAFIRNPAISIVEAWSFVPPVITAIIIIPALFAIFYALLLILKDVIPFT